MSDDEINGYTEFLNLDIPCYTTIAIRRFISFLFTQRSCRDANDNVDGAGKLKAFHISALAGTLCLPQSSVPSFLSRLRLFNLLPSLSFISFPVLTPFFLFFHTFFLVFFSFLSISFLTSFFPFRKKVSGCEERAEPP